MTKGAKIWLWAAMILSVCTTLLNAGEGRIPSVIVALGALVGLGILQFQEKKAGFYLVCVCYVISFIIGVVSGISGGTGVALSVGASLIGSLIIPGITYLMLRKQFDRLK